MPFEWKGHMANDPKTSLFIIIESNSFSKLKGLLKYDHFAYKLAQFTLLVKKITFWNTKIQNDKRGKFYNKITCILHVLTSKFNFMGLKPNGSFDHPFMTSFL